MVEARTTERAEDHDRSRPAGERRPDRELGVRLVLVRWPPVDRDTGVIVRLIETIGGNVTRDAVVTVLEPDASLPPSAFEFVFPTGTTMLF